MLLMVIVGLGISYVGSRIATSQKDMNLQSLAVAQLRDLLQRNGSDLDLCSASPEIELPGLGSLSVTVNGCSSSATASVEGVTLDAVASPLSLSVSNSALGGEIVVGATL